MSIEVGRRDWSTTVTSGLTLSWFITGGEEDVVGSICHIILWKKVIVDDCRMRACVNHGILFDKEGGYEVWSPVESLLVLLDLRSLDDGVKWPRSVGPSSPSFFLDKGRCTCKDTKTLKFLSVMCNTLKLRLLFIK